MPHPPRAAGPLGAVVAGVLVLSSGCGVIGTQFHPGLALQVGDTSVTTDHVDEGTRALCHLLVDSSQLTAAVPISSLRAEVVAEAARLAAAQDLARIYAVGPGDGYQDAITSTTTFVDTLSLDSRDRAASVEIGSTEAYVGDIIIAVGTQLLRAGGAPLPTTTSALDAAASAAGRPVLDAYLTAHADVNPLYGVTVPILTGQTQPSAVDLTQSTSLSQAVSSLALAARTADTESSDVSSLPRAQVCS